MNWEGVKMGRGKTVGRKARRGRPAVTDARTCILQSPSLVSSHSRRMRAKEAFSSFGDAVRVRKDARSR
jgi:hypothetical protein